MESDGLAKTERGQGMAGLEDMGEKRRGGVEVKGKEGSEGYEGREGRKRGRGGPSLPICKSF